MNILCSNINDFVICDVMSESEILAYDLNRNSEPNMPRLLTRPAATAIRISCR